MVNSPDPYAAIRAAVAGAPKETDPGPPSDLVSDISAAVTAANTKSVGYSGLALVVASAVLPAVAPDVDKAISSAHIPPILAHAGVAIFGAICALIGRPKNFDD